jgi:tetratricopeptide (TPR) repeat protein
VRALVLLVLISGAAAHAQDAREQAQQLVADADAKLAANDYEGALAGYRDAYARYPSPRLHYNLALCLDGLARPVEAIGEFEAFLAEATDAPIEHRSYASAAIKRLEPGVGRLELRGFRIGLRVTVDDAPAGVTPIPRPIPVVPGEHTITVGTYRQVAKVLAGRQELVIDLSNAPQPITKKWWFWTSAGVVAAAVTVGVVLATRQTPPPCGLGCVPLMP